MKLYAVILAGMAFAVSASAASAQSVEAGEAVFKKCMACHSIGEGAAVKVGPPLNGIVGRKAGTWPNYSYSEANKGSGITWDEATLHEYLKDPRAKVPGTKMAFAGLNKPEDIDNIIAYLKQFDMDGKKK